MATGQPPCELSKDKVDMTSPGPVLPPPPYFAAPPPGQPSLLPAQGYLSPQFGVVTHPQQGIVINQPGTTGATLGGCSRCGVGIIQEQYPMLAIFLAFCFFPFGVLCCLAMKERRCSNCGALY